MPSSDDVKISLTIYLVVFLVIVFVIGNALYYTLYFFGFLLKDMTIEFLSFMLFIGLIATIFMVREANIAHADLNERRGFYKRMRSMVSYVFYPSLILCVILPFLVAPVFLGDDNKENDIFAHSFMFFPIFFFIPSAVIFFSTFASTITITLKLKTNKTREAQNKRREREEHFHLQMKKAEVYISNESLSYADRVLQELVRNYPEYQNDVKQKLNDLQMKKTELLKKKLKEKSIYND